MESTSSSKNKDCSAEQSEVTKEKKCQQQHNKTANSQKVFVDSWGTEWFFHSKAKSEQELTELLQTNGLTNKYQDAKKTVRYRCRKRKNRCGFRGIVVKKSRELYTRNEHNHPIFALAETPKGTDDYMGRKGQHWHFLATINNDTDLAVLLKKNWLHKDHANRNPTKVFYYCRRRFRLKRNGGSKCDFRGVFFKASSKLYTLGQHNHPLRARETPSGEDAYFDINDKQFPFFARINDDTHLDDVFAQNCLKINRQQRPTRTTIKAICRFNKCPVRAIFLKANSKLYLRGEHNHELGIPKQNGIVAQKRKKRVENNSEEDKDGAKESSLDEREEDEEFSEEDEEEADSDSEMEEEHGEEEHFDEEEGNEVEAERQILEENAKEIAEENELVENEALEENGQDLIELQNEPVENELLGENLGEAEERNGDNLNETDERPPPADVQYLDTVKQQEYKMVPPMKKECDVNLGDKQWPIETIESVLPGWQWEPTRSEKSAKAYTKHLKHHPWANVKQIRKILIIYQQGGTFIKDQAAKMHGHKRAANSPYSSKGDSGINTVTGAMI